MNPRRLILTLALLPIAASAQTSVFSTNFSTGERVTSNPSYDPATQRPFFPGKLDGKAYASEEAMRKTTPAATTSASGNRRSFPNITPSG